jgi:hypothetical protein
MDRGNQANVHIQLRDVIRKEIRKIAAEQDQVSLATVTGVGDGVNVEVLLDGFGAGPVNVTWASYPVPAEGQRVVVVALSGGQSWYVVGVLGETAP